MSQSCLYIVATPIGNLGDLSPRAREALAEADVIAAEDTRHSAKLLALAGARSPATSLHEHNEREVVPALIERLQGGESVALISDAGTPLVSDPGFVLVQAARAAGVDVRTVPGPCAAVAALSISGLPSDRFVFEGFLPARPAGRRRRLAELSAETRTLVFYESSHRIVEAVRDLAGVLGKDRQVCLARELTKLHEDSVLIPAGQLAAWLDADDNRRRGEFVLVVAGAEAVADESPRVDLEALLRELLPVMPVRQAVRSAVRLTGMARNDVYRAALALSEEL